MPCKCGKGGETDTCCGALLDGRRAAASAEELMRSRYVAYVRRDIDYLAATQDPSTAKDFDREAAADWARQARWLGLEIVDVEAGDAQDEEGMVEFIARYTVEQQGQQVVQAHHERSRFRQRGGHWFYLDGHAPRRQRAAKVGRNDPCPCGSKRKYKRCCGRDG